MNNIFVLIKKDIISVLRSKSVYLFLLISSYLYGSSFLTAVDLYGKASVTAIDNPLYSKGFEPVFGVFVPAFGGLFLSFTLLLPLCIIPLFSEERKNNTMVLLYQNGYRDYHLLMSKLVSSFSVLLISFIVPVFSIVLWYISGGHICYKELFLLFSGYALYGLIVVAVSLFSGSVVSSGATGSIIAFSILLYSWILDFIKTVSYSRFIEKLSIYSLTSLLKTFERGIFSVKAIAIFVFLILIFILLTFFALKRSLIKKGVYSGLFFLFVFSGFFLISNLNLEKDFTESHRNSFPLPIIDSLKKIPQIKIEVYLRKTDSRFLDYKEEFLNRLLLIKPDTKVVFIEGKSLDDNYGLFVYCVKQNGKEKCENTYSNSPEEAFMVLSSLSGISIPYDAQSDYKGYPLVFSESYVFIAKFLFFLLLPAFFVLLFYAVQKKRFFNRG